MFAFYPTRRLLFFLTLTLFITATSTYAQDEELKPTYVTARVFVARVPRNQVQLTDQLFRLNSATQTNDEKWLSNLKKAYPNALDFALLRTQQLRLFMTPKPGLLMVGDPSLPHIEFQFLLAQGLRQDDSVNTTAITEVNFYSGPKTANPVPISMANNGFEVNSGMTYFFTTDGLRVRHDVYTVYFKERSYAQVLELYDHYLILSLSVEPDKHPAWTIDPAKAAEFQNKATKKVDPQWSEDVTKNRYFGKVQVRVEVGADGKVSQANVWQSSLPEGNSQALAAARQWEFPVSELTGIKSPASALLTFALAPPPPPKAPEQAAPATPTTEKSQAKPTGKPTTATKPPVKRRNN